MSTPKPIAYEITRIGCEPERVQADFVDLEGDPPKYVFRKHGAPVRELFAHALETDPKPILPQTPEQKAAWRKFVKKASAPMQSKNLNRG